MRQFITAARLWQGWKTSESILRKTILPDPILEIEDGLLVSLSDRRHRDLPAGVQVLDFPGQTLAPAFFDIHIHGSAGHDVMEATPPAFKAIGDFLAHHGTGSYLATTVTAPLESTFRSLEGIAHQIEAARRSNLSGALPFGIHLEGPFLSHAKRGVHPPEHLQAPDVSLFDRFMDAANGHIRLITLAPELPGAAELTAHATARGVRVSIGHSNATTAETSLAISAGAVSATHTFNAMRTFDHREPGILGEVLTNPDLYAELICDGIHVAPTAVQLWHRSKGEHRGILVTDAMAATGMPDGQYTLGSFPVQVKNGIATHQGALAGSLLTLNQALENIVSFTGHPIEVFLAMLTENPAAMTGLSLPSDSFQIGQPASFVVLDSAGKLKAASIQGRLQRR